MVAHSKGGRHVTYEIYEVTELPEGPKLGVDSLEEQSSRDRPAPVKASTLIHANCAALRLDEAESRPSGECVPNDSGGKSAPESAKAMPGKHVDPIKFGHTSERRMRTLSDEASVVLHGEDAVPPCELADPHLMASAFKLLRNISSVHVPVGLVNSACRVGSELSKICIRTNDLDGCAGG
jgi:hypothetical protein